MQRYFDLLLPWRSAVGWQVASEHRLPLVDLECRPVAYHLTRGQIADCIAAEVLLEAMPAVDLLHGDKGHESDRLRRRIEATGAAPNIPPKRN